MISKNKIEQFRELNQEYIEWFINLLEENITDSDISALYKTDSFSMIPLIYVIWIENNNKKYKEIYDKIILEIKNSLK